MPNLELTPYEVIRLVQGLKTVSDSVLIANEKDEVTFWTNDKHTKSLLKKIVALGDDPEVKTLIEEM